MAKKKSKKTGSSAKKSKPKKRKVEHEPCPSCGEARPLFWHGRRVLCEPCIDDNTHQAERGEITSGTVVSGALALFRDVGLWAVILIAGYTGLTKLALGYASLSEEALMAAKIASELVGLFFVIIAYDLGLTTLDGDRPTLASSAGIAVRKFFPALLTNALAGMIILVHFILLIIPGVVKSLSYAIVMPLVISGEAGAISSLHESWKRMKGHRMSVAPVVIVIWVIPFLVIQYVGSVALLEPAAVEAVPAFGVIEAVYPLFEIPWLFVALSLHAKLRARHRISAD